MRCWGNNQYGQLGYGHTNPIGDNQTPGAYYATLPSGDVPLGGTAIHVSAGDTNTCATLATGQVLCWGHGYYGIQGTGTCATANQPPDACDVGNEPGEMPPAPVALCAP